MFDGQSLLTSFIIFKNNQYLTSVSASTYSYDVTGLQNGVSYNFAVCVINAIGTSVKVSRLMSHHLELSIVSVVATGKQLTVVLNPNGKPIQNVVMVALDSNPNDIADGDFVVSIPQQNISQLTSQNVTVIKNFSSFSSDIDFWCVIAHNDSGSVFLKQT